MLREYVRVDNILLFIGNIPRGVFCERRSQKTRDISREFMRDYKCVSDTNMQSHRKEREDMEKKTKYYVVREKAVPEVLLKVVEAKRILDSERATTVQEATEQVGISRSSFYKYKDDIFPFHDQAKGRTVTFILQMDDKPGILSDILRTVAEFRGNILTIHQSIPINGIATLTLSVEILPEAGDAEDMIGQMEQQTGVHYLKILGRE